MSPDGTAGVWADGPAGAPGVDALARVLDGGARHSSRSRRTPGGPGRRYSVRVPIALRDPELLAAALTDLGYAAVETHARPQPLYGQLTGAARAEVIVRGRHAGAGRDDLGFLRRPDSTHALVVSGRDRSRFDRRWLARVTRAYGCAVVRHFARGHGYQMSPGAPLPGGARRLVLRPRD